MIFIKIEIQDENGETISSETRKGSYDVLHNVDWNMVTRELLDETNI